MEPAPRASTFFRMISLQLLALLAECLDTLRQLGEFCPDDVLVADESSSHEEREQQTSPRNLRRMRFMVPPGADEGGPARPFRAIASNLKWEEGLHKGPAL